MVQGLRMRKIFAVVCLGAGASLAATAIASAATACRTGPPKEWNQPRVTYTFSGETNGRGLRGHYASHSRPRVGGPPASRARNGRW